MSEDKTIIADSSLLNQLRDNKPVTACLVQYNGAGLGKRYLMDKPEIVIGRSPDTQVVVNDQSVSRQHARCYLSADKLEIEDLGSSNGTFINDEKISGRTALRDGDILRLGTVLLKYFSQNNIENLVHDKIYRMATIDAGTDIFNKKYLIESLETAFAASKSTGKPLSVIYFDLDHFKKVNDTYGHNAGDFILRKTAELVKSMIRKDDVFCRFGGEEFVILMPDTLASTAFEKAERVRQAMEAHQFAFEGTQIKQTVSLGVSQLTPEMGSPGEFLESADKKLYHSKKTGRNRVTV